MKSIYSILGCLAAFLLGFFAGCHLWKSPQKPVEIVQVDTVWCRDTVVYTQTEVKYVERIKTEYDTVTLTTTQHDTVLVEVPIEHKHEHYSDADVWYHGFRAGIDSLAVYPETAYITVTEREKAQPKPWGLGVQAGYGVTKLGGPVVYVGLGISYNLIRF